MGKAVSRPLLLFLCLPDEFSIFFPPSNNSFALARATAVRSAVPNAMFKDAANNRRGVAGSLRDIQGQLNRVTKIYTQYLTISAKSNFFVPLTTTIQPTVQTWMPRLWMDKLATHIMAALLLFVAFSMAALQYIHRKKRSRLFLAGPVGSIASDVSLTSSAKFGLLLNAGDTQRDLERKLGGMRFGIEHSTGQIIVEREDRNSMMTLVQEDGRPFNRGAIHRHTRYPTQEDVRASLLSNKARSHHDSFVGLRGRESYATSNGRLSAVGSTAPLLSSPPPSSKSSQTAFPSLSSPTPSTTAFRSSSTNTLLSPPPSSSTARFSPPTPTPLTTTTPTSTTRYSAPPGPPPPQLQAQNPYYDPYGPNST